MKTLKKIILFAIFFSFLLWKGAGGESYAQCLPLIKIDGNYIVADENNVKGLKLPIWLTAGQTLVKDQYVYSISVIEFTVNGSALDFSQNLKVTAIQTVPTGKTWKIESILKDMSMPTSSTGVTYDVAGTYTFTTPSCITTAYIQVWSGGGGGGYGYSGGYGGNGGGAGGYSEGSYQLPASTNYTIVVGSAGTRGTSDNAAGGNGGTSSVSTIGLSATGGGGATNSSNGSIGGTAGVGSGGQMNLTGQAGFGWGNPTNGVGGIGAVAPYSANSSGGAGSGGAGGNYTGGVLTSGGTGGAGKVNISFGSSGSTTLTPKVPCVVMYLRAYNGTTPASCPSGWTQADYQLEYDYSTPNNVRTCMRCD